MLECCICRRVPIPLGELFLKECGFSRKTRNKWLQIVNQPRKDCNLVCKSGAGKSCKDWILVGSGHMPWPVKTAP